MRERKSFSLIGLVMKSRAPWRMPHTRSVSIDLVVMMRIGTSLVFGSRLKVRVAWKPFMPGMMTSMITASGNLPRTCSMPSSALPTLETVCPAFSSNVVNTRTSVGESSMMRICAMKGPVGRLRVRRMLANGVQQLVTRKGFGQILLGADDASAGLVEQTILGTEHDYRGGAKLLIVLDQGTGLVAVQPGHHDVDKDHLRFLIADL